MNNLSVFRESCAFSISAENISGEKGMGGRAVTGTGAFASSELGIGFKVSPSLVIGKGQTVTLADFHGEGAIKHIWMTPTGIQGRQFILRFYWDDYEFPSVECPIGDFFANAFIPEFIPVNSLAVCVNPKNGLNCYWDMPFYKGFRITVQNISDTDTILYYQIDGALYTLPDDSMYFQAQYRQSRPLEKKSDHTLLCIDGKGSYVGTYVAWGSHSNGWWGEGEVKFYIDGDNEFPTICTTGTEDYFCGAYNFDNGNGYVPFSTAYAGFAPVKTDGLYKSQCRFSLYRWHICDSICFCKDIKATVAALGWTYDGKYLPLNDDIMSTSFYYLTKPQKLTPLPSRRELEMN